MTAAASDGEVKLTCKVRACSLYWFVNDTWYSGINENTQLLLQKGFSFSDLLHGNNNSITGSVNIDVSAININNTILWCHASCMNETVSSNATIHIAGMKSVKMGIVMNSKMHYFIGVPLSPCPIFMVLDIFTIGVKWDAPFSWPLIPITNYTVQVMNQTNDEMLASTVLTAETLSYNITRTTTLSCDNIVFLVTANNRIGASTSVEIIGHFPAGRYS